MLPVGEKRPREAVNLDDALLAPSSSRPITTTAASPAAFNLDAVFGMGGGQKVNTNDIRGALPPRAAASGRRRVVGGLFGAAPSAAVPPPSTTNDVDPTSSSVATATIAPPPSKEAVAAKNTYLDSLLKNDPSLAVLTPFEQEKRLDTGYLRTLTNFNKLVGSGVGSIVGGKLYESSNSSATEKADGAALANTYGSLLLGMFGSGVAEVDPVDLQFLTMPKYDAPLVDTSVMQERIGKMYHPVPTITDSILERELANPDLYGPAPIRLAMTPAERKKEKHARKLEKRTEHQKKVQAGEVEEKQKLTAKHLSTVLKDQHQSNAVGTENQINAEKEQRILEHEKANHEAHMAALPNQIEKRERDLWADVEKDPSLCVFRLFPIREEMTLHTFAKFANDHKMRGFILWIANRDAIIVMAGGAGPMRHITNWITGRMQWRETAQTKSALVYSTRIRFLDRLGFHEPKGNAEEESTNAAAAAAAEEEESIFDKRQQRVYLKSVETVSAGFKYLTEAMPSEGPWPSLQHIWDTAMAEVPV